jgi:catechol 2,3-dioxygenase-like lactoylglutathione lyase family enzyme
MRRIEFLVIGGVVALLGCGSAKKSPLQELAAASDHDQELAPPIPIFSVRDLRSSQRYFRDVLGFKIEWEDGNPPDFTSVSRSGARLFMCHGCQGKPGSWAFSISKDVDQLHEELKRKGALIRRPPTNEPWRMREMQVADPDGNVIRFASSLDR